MVERLQDQLRQLMSQDRVKHAIVAVESTDKSFRWVGTAGDAYLDGTPMQEDTPFWIASVTKLYIATAVMKLYERGNIRLQNPMATYLPASLIDGLHCVNGVDHTDNITVRHLLSHTSGLPEYLESPSRGQLSLFDRAIEQDRSWAIEEVLQIVRDLKPYFPPQPLEAKRQKARYSDTNFQLLIEIIEAVTGKRVNEAFAELIYGPLNLKNTLHPHELEETTPKPATLWHDDQPLDRPLAMASFRDLCSTADDLLAFMRALIRDEVFDDSSTRMTMMENFNRFGFSLSPVAPSWPIEYGLGIMRFRIPRIFSPLRATPDMVGHTGVSGSWLFYSSQLEVLLCGTVDQLTAPDVPFRFVPNLLRTLDAARR